MMHYIPRSALRTSSVYVIAYVIVYSLLVPSASPFIDHLNPGNSTIYGNSVGFRRPKPTATSSGNVSTPSLLPCQSFVSGVREDLVVVETGTNPRNATCTDLIRTSVCPFARHDVSVSDPCSARPVPAGYLEHRQHCMVTVCHTRQNGLLDRLLVTCPNADFCQDVMQKCDLHDHLIYSCRGTRTNCVNAELGCNFQGTRGDLQQHIDTCVYNEKAGKRLWRIVWTPIQEGRLTTVDINVGCYSLGISIVGGIDTPLNNIIIQEIFLNGSVYKDGRLLPGDQLIQVNGIELTKLTHCQATAALSCSGTSLCTLVVYREPAECDVSVPGNHSTRNNCCRKSSSTSSESQWAENSDSLRECSSLNDNDRCIENEVISSSPTWPCRSPDREPADVSPRSWYSTSAYRVKVITVSKESSERLGIGIAGGRFSCGYDTPIYVTNIQPNGCLARTGQICKGDVLLAVNGTSLLNLTHNEAVLILKTATVEPRRKLHLLQVVSGLEPDGESPEVATNFRPTWNYWLALPSLCYSVKTITLERPRTGPLGFSVVTGKRRINENSPAVADCFPTAPVFVKSVLPNSPASVDGRLRSGDIILSIDGHSIDGASHDDVVRLLARWRDTNISAKRFVVLTVVSWPGSPV